MSLKVSGDRFITMNKVAYIIDGGFFTKLFLKHFKKFPTANDVEEYIKTIQNILMKKTQLPLSIYRVFFYDCKPNNRSWNNPFNNQEQPFHNKKSIKDNEALQKELELKNYFAVRYGDLKKRNGNNLTIKGDKIGELKTRKVMATDVYMETIQKGVDMKMGLDVASITSKKLCSHLVLISGDTDLIPAMKLARKEGVCVCLHRFVKEIHQDLFSHSDFIIYHHMLKEVYKKKISQN